MEGIDEAWSGALLGDFGDKIGVSLEELGREYDEMIKSFEVQKGQLRNFPPRQNLIIDGAPNNFLRPPSPNDASKSNKEENTLRRAFSTAGIQSSIKTAKKSIRRKISSRADLPLSPLARSKDHSSQLSLSKLDSEVSVENDNEVFQINNT